MTLINLTPHDIVIYPPTTPDRIDPAEHGPVHIVKASGTVARIETSEDDEVLDLDGMPVHYVTYRNVTGLPRQTTGTWLVVSLATALAKFARPDLLIPYREVRHAETNTVIGCRMLARPV